MTDTATHVVEHQIEINVPADDVYRLIADVTGWPQVFTPTVHVEYLERSATEERIRIWATANGEIKTWVSRRTLDPVQRRIEFRQEISAHPVAAMGGTWLIEPAGATGSVVRLLHDYRAVDDDPAHLEWIERAVDTNSRSELATLKSTVEAASAELTFSFDDHVHVDGRAADVFDFLNEAQLWNERLPHVARVALTEPTSGVQWLEMDTLTRDGSKHTTRSVRVCFPKDRIVYKQTTLPALMTLHTGRWTIVADADGGPGLTVTSQHTVTINEANIERILGAGADIAAAREFVQRALSANSCATLRYAKEFAESRG
jgi:aromatase